MKQLMPSKEVVLIITVGTLMTAKEKNSPSISTETKLGIQTIKASRRQSKRM
jgi:hypothetical protein